MGARVFSASLTIRDPDQVKHFVDDVWNRFGALDVLVNNAGGQFPQMALDFKVKGWNAVIDTNLNGSWYMMQSAAQQWVEEKSPGSIVNNVADIWRGMPGIAHWRYLPLQIGRGRMGALSHPRQLRRAWHLRDERLQTIFSRRPEDISGIEPHAALGTLMISQRRSLTSQRPAANSSPARYLQSMAASSFGATRGLPGGQIISSRRSLKHP